jgi:hypothetical protein
MSTRRKLFSNELIIMPMSMGLPPNSEKPYKDVLVTRLNVEKSGHFFTNPKWYIHP